jgi:hypothetical protein
MNKKYIDFYVMPLDYLKTNNEFSQWRLTAFERSDGVTLNEKRVTLFDKYY